MCTSCVLFCKHVCVCVYVYKEARGVEALTSSLPYSGLVSVRQSLMVSADGVVSCHISTAVPTWTLAWLDHPSFWQL